MQVFPDTPATRFMHAFWRLRQVLVAQVSPVLRAAHDLEMAEVFLLEYIGRSDLSPSEIAGALHLPAHAISRRLDTLEKRGLIRRSLDPHDARRRVLELTPAGEALLTESARTLEEQVATLLEVLAPDTLTTMLSTMEQLAEGSSSPTPRDTERA